MKKITLSHVLLKLMQEQSNLCLVVDPKHLEMTDEDCYDAHLLVDKKTRTVCWEVPVFCNNESYEDAPDAPDYAVIKFAAEDLALIGQLQALAVKHDLESVTLASRRLSLTQDFTSHGSDEQIRCQDINISKRGVKVVANPEYDDDTFIATEVLDLKELDSTLIVSLDGLTQGGLGYEFHVTNDQDWWAMPVASYMMAEKG
jgi:hypothetical protein